MGVFTGGKQKNKPLEQNSIIATGCTIRGEVELDSNLHVDGLIEGKIISRRAVQVGKTGRVLGEIDSKNVLISGIVEGKIIAETVELTANGLFEGEVVCKEFIIEKGGQFVGMSATIKENNVTTIPYEEIKKLEEQEKEESKKQTKKRVNSKK